MKRIILSLFLIYSSCLQSAQAEQTAVNIDEVYRLNPWFEEFSQWCREHDQEYKTIWNFWQSHHQQNIFEYLFQKALAKYTVFFYNHALSSMSIFTPQEHKLIATTSALQAPQFKKFVQLFTRYQGDVNHPEVKPVFENVKKIVI